MDRDNEILPPEALPRRPGAAVFVSTDDGLLEIEVGEDGEYIFLPVGP